jgi:UPF0755 protein
MENIGNRISATLLGFGIFIFLICLALWSFSSRQLPDKNGFPKRVVIPPGLGSIRIAEMLTREGVLRSPYPFLFRAWICMVSSKIKAGEYLFSVPEPPKKVLEKLVRGEVIIHKVTIPEGFTLRQIANLLEKKGLAKEAYFMAWASDTEFLSQMGIDGDTAEGYLFPETYFFPAGIGEKEILKKMITRFWEVFGLRERERAREMGLQIRDIVIIASIIEKETSFDQEKPLISAVFHNRIKRGLRLESDPTVIYGLSDFNGNLKRKDLLKEGPYNTYINPGLPPGPIANPGQSSILAALYPAEIDYLFFVSRNDGTHYFSKSLAEHNRAVLKYQKMKNSPKARF